MIMLLILCLPCAAYLEGNPHA